MNSEDTCTVGAATREPPPIGHNNGPPSAPLFGLHAAWLRYANARELKRLAKLHVRIERKKAALQELVQERQRIMHRSIRRMRRANGKDLALRHNRKTRDEEK